tara:strand:- start:282 stop:749 length:468 start_codon:yes stop_codon:yes gene_type:complete
MKYQIKKFEEKYSDELFALFLKFQQKAGMEYYKTSKNKMSCLTQKLKETRQKLFSVIADSNMRFIVIDTKDSKISAFICYKVKNQEAEIKTVFTDPYKNDKELLIDSFFACNFKLQNVRKIHSNVQNRNRMKLYKIFLERKLNGKICGDKVHFMV